MLFYTGDIRFIPHSMGGGGPMGGGGLGGMLSGAAGVAGRMMQGEHVALMSVQGDGEAHFGRAGLYIDVIMVDAAAQLTVEASRLLAYEGYLQTSIVPLSSSGGVRGMVRGAVTHQGMFTSQISGQGAVAVLSHGGTVELEVGAGRPSVVVDPQAYVAHRGAVQVELSANVGLRDMVGRGSGEALQLRLSGQGTVWVQASEKKL
jgi:uncharacterized protein (AIM24 family)